MVIGRKKIYYGWIIVAVGVIMMMSYGIVNNPPYHRAFIRPCP